MSAEPITRLPDPRSIGRELSELARQCDDRSDPHVIAQVMLTSIHVRHRDAALAHLLAHEVVRARGTAGRQITGAGRRGTSRADIIAENAQEFALYAMNVAVQGAFSQPFGDCVAAEVEMLAQYYADLAQCAALEQRCCARVVELFKAHPGAACVRDLPYDEVERAMTDA